MAILQIGTSEKTGGMKFGMPVGMATINDPLSSRQDAIAGFGSIADRIVPLLAFDAERAAQIYDLVTFPVFTCVFRLTVAAVAIVQR